MLLGPHHVVMFVLFPRIWNSDHGINSWHRYSQTSMLFSSSLQLKQIVYLSTFITAVAICHPAFRKRQCHTIPPKVSRELAHCVIVVPTPYGEPVRLQRNRDILFPCIGLVKFTNGIGINHPISRVQQGMIKLYIESGSGSGSLVADEVVLDHGEYKSKLSCTSLTRLLTFDLERQHLHGEYVNLFNEAHRLDKPHERPLCPILKTPGPCDLIVTCVLTLSLQCRKHRTCGSTMLSYPIEFHVIFFVTYSLS